MEKDVKPMQFPDGSGKRVNMMYPVDNTFWTKLKDLVDYEPVSAIDPELRGVLASIGIVKGQPFIPILTERDSRACPTRGGSDSRLAYLGVAPCRSHCARIMMRRESV
jgi:hypothetical protein